MGNQGMIEEEPSSTRAGWTQAVREDVVLHVVLESITDYAVFTLDADGRIESWPLGAERIKQFKADEVIGKHFEMLYLPEDRARGLPRQNLEKAAKRGTFQQEGQRMRKDGTPFDADVTISAIREDSGELVGFIKIVRDITSRRQQERQITELTHDLQRKVISQTAKLQAANEDLEGFCYSIAHDLRAPLRAIIANARLLEEECGEHVGEVGQQYVDRLTKASRRMSDLVDDLLAFARVGRHEIRRKPVDLTEMARQIADESCEHCQSGTAEFEIDEDIKTEADPELIRVVLDNLISNACKYSRPGVRIHVGKANIAGQDVFYVKDDGIGFDMQYHEKLFRPFERLHLDSAYEGTGIGLANVKRIVGRHGGKIWAQSMPGEGATFFFTLSAGAGKTSEHVDRTAFGLK